MSTVVKLLSKDGDYYTFSIQNNEGGRFGKAEVKEYKGTIFKGFTDQQCIDLVKTFNSMGGTIPRMIGDPDEYDVIEMNENEEEYETVGLSEYLSQYITPLRVFCVVGIAILGTMSGYMMVGTSLASDPTHGMSNEQMIGYYQTQIDRIELEQGKSLNHCKNVCEEASKIYDGDIMKLQTQQNLIRYEMQ